jgi:hypothetical protein
MRLLLSEVVTGLSMQVDKFRIVNSPELKRP